MITWQDRKVLEFPMQKREWEKREEEQFTSKKFMRGLGFGMLISAALWLLIFRLVYLVAEVLK